MGWRPKMCLALQRGRSHAPARTWPVRGRGERSLCVVWCAGRLASTSLWTLQPIQRARPILGYTARGLPFSTSCPLRQTPQLHAHGHGALHRSASLLLPRGVGGRVVSCVCRLCSGAIPPDAGCRSTQPKHTHTSSRFFGVEKKKHQLHLSHARSLTNRTHLLRAPTEPTGLCSSLPTLCVFSAPAPAATR